MILNYDKVETFLNKVNIDSKKFIDSSEEYVFQEKGNKSKYIVNDNFKTLTYNFADKKNGISIRGKIQFFEPNIFVLIKGSEYFNKQIANQKAFGKLIMDLRFEVSKNSWSTDKGHCSKSSVNICFYAPSGVYSFITGLSNQYHKGYFWGIDGKALKTKFNSVSDISEEKINSLGISENIEKEIQKINDDPLLTPTEKDAIRKARIGQGKFRTDLLEYYEEKCVVSKINAPELLIASHILPWSESDNKQRVDKSNGLLLSSSIDKLFDNLLISFDDNGFMLISKKFKNKYKNYADIMKKIGIYEEFINSEKSIEFDENTKKYLKIHANKTRNL